MFFRFSSATFMCLLAAGTGLAAVTAFQVKPENSPLYKKAIEDTLQTKVVDPPQLVVVDDRTFSPEIGSEDKSPVQLPLSKSIKSNFPPARAAVRRKTFGIDDMPHEYWFNNKIHTFGNTGMFGGLHAFVAPIATRLIDELAYKGQNVRTTISQELRSTHVKKSGARVLDLCCGVGISTRALESAFQDAEVLVGIDTSPEMISMARAISRHESWFAQFFSLLRSKITPPFSRTGVRKKPRARQSLYAKSGSNSCKAVYARGNAERTKFPEQSFDLVTVMYAFHEAPLLGRYRILRECRRLLRHGGSLALVDISTDYTPSPSMLAGEPYVLEYQQNIEKQMRSIAGFADLQYRQIVPGHVSFWLLTRKMKGLQS